MQPTRRSNVLPRTLVYGQPQTASTFQSLQTERLHQPHPDTHSYQCRQAVGLHALHHPGAVEIHGLDADAQLLGYLAVASALHQRQQHVPLPWGELIQALLYFARLWCCGGGPRTLAQGPLHAVQQQLLVVGLLDEVHRPGAEGAYHYGHIGMGADEDHRQLTAALAQGVLHRQPAHAGHADIQQYAGRYVFAAAVEKNLAGGEGHRLQTYRLQQPDGGLQHALIVVHHIHALRMHLHIHFSVTCSCAGNTGSQPCRHRPPVSAGRASSPPPKPSMMLRLMDSPNPRPSSLPVKNRVNRLASCSGASPGPWSVTSRCTRRSSWLSVSQIREGQSGWVS